ncbi:MAG: hypothetical protein EAX96_16965 [Candidatus Lokiarchaeota archaeon]|nr:hypothetical protein [Candidatus Lokiarchaeota archaeon]
MFNLRSQDEIAIENSNLAKITERFLDIIAIRQILIIHRKSGTTIFSKSFIEKETDPDLISGFLTAISAFEQELAGVTGGLEELKYKNIRILISIGQLISTCLIIDGDRIPSESLYETFKEFKLAFEERFKIELQQFEGFVAPFRNIDDLLEKYLEVSLLDPHILLGKEYYLYLPDIIRITEKDLKEIKILPYDELINTLNEIIKIV